MLCQFTFRESGAAGRWQATCVHCGRTALVRSRRVYAACHATTERLTNEQLAAIVSSGAEPDGWRPVRVGDLVESGLRRLGITKRRWRRWTGAKRCGCSKRQSWLNVWGDIVQRRIRGALIAAKQFYLPA